MKRWRADKLKGLENFKQTDNMLSAQISDSDEIIKLLNDTFDSYVSHLPTEEKLKNLIKNNLLFYIKENNKIITAFCFEKFANESFYVYQIAVDKNFRGYGVGKEIVHYALSNYQNKKIYTSWVEHNNISSQKIHKNVVFIKDGLSDYVFIYK